MTKLKRRIVSAFAAVALLAATGGAFADYAIKDGGGVTRTLFAFVCQTSKICPAHVLIDSSGNEISPAISSKQDTTNLNLGAPGDTACASDTGSCGHNALLQRIAQRLTTLVNGSFRTTYRIAGIVTPAASATDVVTLSGGTRTVRITRATFSASLASAGVGSIALIKRSVANAGGTSTTPAAVALDSTNAAATATVRVYTANPSALGTAVGNIGLRAALYNTGTAQPDRVSFEFGDQYKQAVVLRGSSELLAFNVAAASPAAAFYEIEWTEE
jgi:hypothetical protein